MGRLVLDDDDRVCAWLDAQQGLPAPSVVQTAIGYERDGQIVAAVMFEGLTDNNIIAHIASTARVFPGDLLVAVAKYVYWQLGLERMTFFVQERNNPCIRFVEKLGAVLEGRMFRGTRAGDVLIFALWRDCRIHRLFMEAGKV